VSVIRVFVSVVESASTVSVHVRDGSGVLVSVSGVPSLA